jgi:hypothetical protein
LPHLTGTPEGFAYRQRKNGDVAITDHGRSAAVLRKGAASRFLREVEGADPQEAMARVTDNYRWGTERRA